MKNFTKIAWAFIGFTAGVWAMFCFMQSIIVQEFGPTGLTGANATFNQLSNEIMDDMAILYILSFALTITLAVVLLVEVYQQRNKKK